MIEDERPVCLPDDDDIEEIDDEPGMAPGDYRDKRHRRLQKKNVNFIYNFIGKGRRYTGVLIVPRYYGELLTWALHRHLEEKGWQTIRVLGYKGSEPVFIDVNTELDKSENLLMNGQMLVEKDNLRFIITFELNPRWRGCMQVEGILSDKDEVNGFVESVNKIAHERNFYRGKKLEFNNRITFLDLRGSSWDSIVLDENTKKDIKANTVEFQKKSRRWAKFGIPPKRGVLLAGEPGTGKTAICKALLAEADGVTCIAANPAILATDGYIDELYEIASDLSPSMVLVEDIDQIGQDRGEFGYSSGPALPSVLSVLDGIEEQKEIITIGTTNHLRRLDKALSQRPSRFDRIINLPLPSLGQRKELINLLSRKIPLDEVSRDYLALRTSRCTPAQLQEIVFSLVLERDDEPPSDENTRLSFNRAEIENAISKINDRNERHIGFCMASTLNGNGVHRMYPVVAE